MICSLTFQWPPEFQLGGIGETGAAHDESEATFVFVTARHVGGLRDVGFAVVGVDDLLPGFVVDLGDTCSDLFVIPTVIDHRTPRRVRVSTSA